MPGTGDMQPDTAVSADHKYISKELFSNSRS